MAWSKERKREERAKKKKEFAKQQKALGKRMLKEAPPLKMLKKPYGKNDVGNTNKDHGGHQKALNFPLEEMVNGELQLGNDPISMHNETVTHLVQRIGTLTIGLVYDGDWKQKSKLAGKGEKQRCNVSERFLPFLLTVREMVMPFLEEELKLWVDDSLRINILCGARTLSHTDSYRGNTPNLLYIPGGQPGATGCLMYDTFPRFKCSVVTIHGEYYIPHNYSEASGEVRCIGEDPERKGFPIFVIFPMDALDAMLPVGDLSFGVVGWKRNGDINVIPEYEGVCLYTKPANGGATIFLTKRWQEIIDEAKSNPVLKRPRKRIVTLGDTDKWMQFRAYQYRHWWTGNPNLVRYHVFFRTVREVPTCSNIIRNGTRINYIRKSLESETISGGEDTFNDILENLESSKPVPVVDSTATALI